MAPPSPSSPPDPAMLRRLKENAQATLDLFGAGVEIMRQNLRRRHPNWTDTQVVDALQTWLDGDLRVPPGSAGRDLR